MPSDVPWMFEWIKRTNRAREQHKQRMKEEFEQQAILEEQMQNTNTNTNSNNNSNRNERRVAFGGESDAESEIGYHISRNLFQINVEQRKMMEYQSKVHRSITNLATKTSDVTRSITSLANNTSAVNRTMNNLTTNTNALLNQLTFMQRVQDSHTMSLTTMKDALMRVSNEVHRLSQEMSKVVFFLSCVFSLFICFFIHVFFHSCVFSCIFLPLMLCFFNTLLLTDMESWCISIVWQHGWSGWSAWKYCYYSISGWVIHHMCQHAYATHWKYEPNHKHE